MSRLNNIISDLRSLEGQLVGKGGYFEHIYTNNTNDTIISIIDILENLKSYEIETFEIYNYCNEEEDDIIEIDVDEFLEAREYEEIKSDNSYNWLAPISNHFNYRIYKSSLYEGIIVEFKVHRFGDVRCNYTEETYLQFDDEYEFYEVLEESSKYFTIEKNDKIYQIEINIFSDCPRIYTNEDGDIEGYEALELLEKLLED